MPPCVTLACIPLIFLSGLQEPDLHGQTDPSEGWVLKRDHNQVVIYTREHEASNLLEYQVSAVIHSPLDKVFGFLSDLEIRPEWVINCQSLTVVEKLGEEDYIYHTVFDLPWPLSDRDLVVRSTHHMAADGRSATLLALRSDREWSRARNTVRMPQYREAVTLKAMNGQQTLFHAEGFADPGGSLPAWIINLFMVDGVYDSVIRTREMAEKQSP